MIISRGDAMEEYEIIILGDGSTVVICAQSATREYPEKSVTILISDCESFNNNISFIPCKYLYD